MCPFFDGSLVGMGSSWFPMSGASKKPRVPLSLSSGNLDVLRLGFESSLVGAHHPPDVIRQTSFQASHGFVAGLAFGDLLVVVGASDAVAHSDLGDSDEMDRRVEAAVPQARETMSTVIPAGDLDWCDASVGSERVSRGNRDALPVRPISRTAVTGPTPSISRSRVPWSSSTAVIRFSMSPKLVSTERSSRTRS